MLYFYFLLRFEEIWVRSYLVIKDADKNEFI